MLDVSLVRNGEVIYKDFALNDVVANGIVRMIDVTVWGDDRKITSFSGDGVVVATPTGSTAYSMSAGGPIVEPSAENIIITPICAHVLVAKSFVLAPDRKVTVEIGSNKGNQAYLTSDGGTYVSLRDGDRINVSKSSLEAQFIHLPDKSFYDKVREKLGEKS